MAGITDAAFLNKVIPYGFDVATLGGFNLDSPTITACQEILNRGRKEFCFDEDIIFEHIEHEVADIKEVHPNVLVSCNVRSTTPEPIIKASKTKDLDIIEVNCHCRQKELLDIGCGQNMLKRPDFEDFIKKVVDNAGCDVSVKIRANVPEVDILRIASVVDDAGVDYLHVDAMAPGIRDADYDLLRNIVNNTTNVRVIGNNSVNSTNQAKKMMNTGVFGFSIARAVISGNLSFNLSDF